MLAALLIRSGADIAVALWIEDLPARVHRLAGLVSHLGDSLYYILAALALLLVTRFVWRNRRLFADAMLFLAVIVGTGVAVNLAKLAVGRTRPGALHDHGIHAFEPLSGNGALPSGHSTVAGAILIFVIMAYPRWWPLAAVILLATGLARLLAGYHYPSDVLCGWTFGIFGGYLIIRLFVRRGWWPRSNG